MCSMGSHQCLRVRKHSRQSSSRVSDGCRQVFQVMAERGYWDSLGELGGAHVRKSGQVCGCPFGAAWVSRWASIWGSLGQFAAGCDGVVPM